MSVHSDHSDQSSIASEYSSYDNEDTKEDYILEDIPSTILWTQKLESITLQIKVNHVRVALAERYLELSVEDQKITLPLYSQLCIQQFDMDQIMNINTKLEDNTVYLTLEKEFPILWPHLLMQQTDEEVTNYLLEANFLIHIYGLPPSPIIQSEPYDTLDFDTVINGHGQKTGLE